MQSAFGLVFLSLLVFLGGCASQTGTAAARSAAPGKHLVYRDAAGTPTMQFDYPSEDFCRKVEAIARRDGRCEAKSAESELQAKATLRYDPPGMLVEGHYPDLARCRSATSSPAPGVELFSPCATKEPAGAEKTPS
jgi:hypothetical protein